MSECIQATGEHHHPQKDEVIQFTVKVQYVCHAMNMQIWSYGRYRCYNELQYYLLKRLGTVPSRQV